MIRDVGFLKWKDPTQWMEAMRGPRWRARMNQENNHFTKVLKSVATVKEIATTAKQFRAYSDEADQLIAYELSIGTTHIHVTEGGGGDLIWWWHGSKKKSPLAGSLDMTDDSVVVYTSDIRDGGRHYNMLAVGPDRVIWSFDGRGKHGLSADVAILAGRVYCLEAAGPLQYKWLVSVDLKTGKDRRVHYEEHQHSTTLALIRGENKALFLLTENGGLQALYHVGPKGVSQLEKDAKVFFPVGFREHAQDHAPCYFFRKEFDARWEVKGAALKELRLPKEFYTSGIDLVRLREGIVVYRRHGERFMFQCDNASRPVLSFWGEIEENPWAVWNGLPADMRLFVPGQTPSCAVWRHGIHLEKPAAIYGGILRHGFTRSKDGSSVRWLCSWREKPRALLVIGYGAYGMTTPVGTTRWRPYIEAGFAVGFAFVRGGGDHNDAWAEAGRREGKERGVEDFEACIRALQEVTGVAAEKTCIFGRSAGGYLVGTTVLRNLGGLAKYVYVEAPYVDVLQTASNVKLPLTVPEYLEFGDPAHKIFDFETMLRLSPVSGLGPEGAPGVFVLCRAGLNDRQVYAYESVKWMDALRGGRKEDDKILFLTEGVGHNVHGELESVERAEDFLILSQKILDDNS